MTPVQIRFAVEAGLWAMERPEAAAAPLIDRLRFLCKINLDSSERHKRIVAVAHLTLR